MPTVLTPLALVELSSAPVVSSTSISLVQAAPNVACASTASFTQTFSAATTIGNWVIACTYGNTGSAGTVTGGGVTTWTKETSNYYAGVFGGEIWYGHVTSAATVVTYAPGGGSNFCGMVASEWAGIQVATPVSSFTASGPTGEDPVVGSGSVVSAAGQLAVVLCAVGTPLLYNPPQEPGVGWTTIGFGANGGSSELQADYMLGPALATYTPSWPVTSSANANTLGVVFNPSTVVSGTVVTPGMMYYDTTLKAVGVYTGTPGGWTYLDTTATTSVLAAAAATALAAAKTDYPLLRMAYR